jgi:hypothetical protein
MISQEKLGATVGELPTVAGLSQRELAASK